MKVNIIIVCLGLLFQAGAASAAALECVRQDASCDDKGDHFYCTVYAWAIEEFCSPTDVSRRPGLPKSNATAASLEKFLPSLSDGVTCADCEGLQDKWGYQACLQTCKIPEAGSCDPNPESYPNCYSESERCKACSARFGQDSIKCVPACTGW